MFRIRILFLLVVPFLLLSLSVSPGAETKHNEVGIDEQLGKHIPLDLTFTDSEGSRVMLKDIINKPTVLSLVYFHCPGICSPLLTGVGDVIDHTNLKPGVDYLVISVSFDHHETPAIAAKWKKNYLAALKNPIPPESWKFLVGDSVTIRRLTDAVGFYFKPDGRGDFIHAASIMALSPDGKITRYLFGTEFLPFDFKMAISEASQGKAMPTISKLLNYCFSYDPKGRTYAFNVTKVVGTIMLIGMAAFFTVLIVKGRKKGNK
jgi:protein SCO1/2